MVDGDAVNQGNVEGVGEQVGGVETTNGSEHGSGAVGQRSPTPGNTGGEGFATPAASLTRNPLLDRGTDTPGTLGDMLQFASVGLQRGSEGVGNQGSPFQPRDVSAGRGRPGYPRERPPVLAADTRTGEFGGPRRFGGIEGGAFSDGWGN